MNRPRRAAGAVFKMILFLGLAGAMLAYALHVRSANRPSGRRSPAKSTAAHATRPELLSAYEPFATAVARLRTNLAAGAGRAELEPYFTDIDQAFDLLPQAVALDESDSALKESADAVLARCTWLERRIDTRAANDDPRVTEEIRRTIAAIDAFLDAYAALRTGE